MGEVNKKGYKNVENRNLVVGDIIRVLTDDDTMRSEHKRAAQYQLRRSYDSYMKMKDADGYYSKMFDGKVNYTIVLLRYIEKQLKTYNELVAQYNKHHYGLKQKELFDTKNKLNALMTILDENKQDIKDLRDELKLCKTRNSKLRETIDNLRNEAKFRVATIDRITDERDKYKLMYENLKMAVGGAPLQKDLTTLQLRITGGMIGNITYEYDPMAMWDKSLYDRSVKRNF